MEISLCFKVFFIVISVFLSGFSFGKDCTNNFPQQQSHTQRIKISTNETLKAEIISKHYHLTPTDDEVWSSLLPVVKDSKGNDGFDWSIMYRKMKISDELRTNAMATSFLKEISLHDVRIDPDSIHGKAQQTNLEYLLMLNVDNLLWSFRNLAGLETPGTPYGGWEAPESQLRGHFVGHFLSSTAKMWASTHNSILYERMTSVVSSLHACQEKIGTGYLSAFSTDEFDKIEANDYAWAPYYTMHKILAGLLDQYQLAGNSKAFRIALWMVDYFSNRVGNVIKNYSIEQHYRSLNEESGGMNDVLYRLYSITGNTKHLVLAHLFDKPCFLGILAVQADSISNFHANTHIPLVHGAQMRYEVTGDPLYMEIGKFFLDIVNSSHTYATGGTSVKEFWTDPKRLATTLQTGNEESCTTYNMLKISRRLFMWTKEMAYADYYERALTNGVLSIQRGSEPGVMIYFLPLKRGGSKAISQWGWGTQFNTFWCCYGTATESFSKMGDSIYFEEEGEIPSLYVIQLISSSINWTSGNIALQQKVEPVNSWDPYVRVTFTVTTNETDPLLSTLHVRIPRWTNSNGAKATLDSQNLDLVPGNFLGITRKWSDGDKLTLQLPISPRTEVIQDDRPEYASLQSVLYGPYLLAGLTNNDWDLKKGNDWITAVPPNYNTHLISLAQESGNETFAVTNSNNSLTMQKLPTAGMNSSVHATFRFVSNDPSNFSSPMDAVGKSFMLEPFDLPGMVVQQGPNNNIAVANAGDLESSMFRVVKGLDGMANTVSLESESQKGCYMYSGTNYNAGVSIKLNCQSSSKDADFNQAVSFILKEGVSQYHPISFVAKGLTRNFLLMPLLSIRDELYTVYFNFTTSI